MLLVKFVCVITRNQAFWFSTSNTCSLLRTQMVTNWPDTKFVPIMCTISCWSHSRFIWAKSSKKYATLQINDNNVQRKYCSQKYTIAFKSSSNKLSYFIPNFYSTACKFNFFSQERYAINAQQYPNTQNNWIEMKTKILIVF